MRIEHLFKSHKISRPVWSGHRRAYSTLHIILAIDFYGAQAVITLGVQYL